MFFKKGGSEKFPQYIKVSVNNVNFIMLLKYFISSDRVEGERYLLESFVQIDSVSPFSSECFPCKTNKLLNSINNGVRFYRNRIIYYVTVG